MSSDRQELMGLLHELARLELDLVVRDQDAEAALRSLAALLAELRVILEQARQARSETRARISGLEDELDGAWGTEAAAELLRRLAVARRELAELDGALGPPQLLQEELRRRCSRKTPQAEPG